MILVLSDRRTHDPRALEPVGRQNDRQVASLSQALCQRGEDVMAALAEGAQTEDPLGCHGFDHLTEMLVAEQEVDELRQLDVAHGDRRLVLPVQLRTLKARVPHLGIGQVGEAHLRQVEGGEALHHRRPRRRRAVARRAGGGTPIPAPPCATTEPSSRSTVTPPTSWPPSWPVSPGATPAPAPGKSHLTRSAGSGRRSVSPCRSGRPCPAPHGVAGESRSRAGSRRAPVDHAPGAARQHSSRAGSARHPPAAGPMV